MKVVTFLFVMTLAMTCITAPTVATTSKEDLVLVQEEQRKALLEAANETEAIDPLNKPVRLLTTRKTMRELKCVRKPRICLTAGSPGPNCCKKKCVDYMRDRFNCGACGKRCKYTEACCMGNCTNLAFDKRHCGRCNNRCKKGDYCIYGLCNYA